MRTFRKSLVSALPLAKLTLIGMAIAAPNISSAQSLLAIEAENDSQTTGSGWVFENSLNGYTGSGYIVWRGSDDFRTDDNSPPAGIKAYDFVVVQPGTYQFGAIVQARVGNGSAESDKDNDAWVKFTSGSATSGIEGDSSKWTKFYVSGGDENWKSYSRGQQYDPEFFTEIQRDLPAGVHRVLIGGRSQRFAIDSVGLNLISANDDVPTDSTPVDDSPTEDNPTNEPILPVGPPASNCSAVGSSLGEARDNFSQQCPTFKREDCDPVDNVWVCASFKMDGSTLPPFEPPMPPQPTPPEPTPPEPTPPEPTPPEPIEPTIPDEECFATGSSLGDARSNYALSCPTLPREDCDPFSGGWICSSGNIGNNSPTVPPVEPPTVPPVEPPTTPPVEPPTTPPVEPPTVPPVEPGTPIGGTRITTSDLLVLHYDNCPDRDDGHAIVAGKAVIDAYGISNTLVVNGTCGAQVLSRYQEESVDVMRAVWGNNWLDGFDDNARSINESADQWAATLANGGDVWLAEGGPSDFTGDVLRRLMSVYPQVDTQNIRIVQHSHGWNEDNTSDDVVDLMEDETDYMRIPDGNHPDNGSADLNEKSDYFVNIAEQSRYASEWEAAFDYLNPNSKLDFSDAVEVLFIVNDTDTDTVDDFANRYLR